MKTVYSMPSTLTASPSRSGSPSSFSSSRKQPEKDAAVAAQASTSVRRRRPLVPRRHRFRFFASRGRAAVDPIGRGSLSLGPEPFPARMRAETRQCHRLETGHRRARERLVALLLEDLPEPREGDAVLLLDPAARAERLLEGVPSRSGLCPERELHPCRLALRAQIPDGPELVTAEPARMSFLDQPARSLDGDELNLGPLLRAGVLEPKPRRGA